MLTGSQLDGGRRLGEARNVSAAASSGEPHDCARQRELQKLAELRACELIDLQGVGGVLLTGSVARGPVHAGSDLDLHLVLDQEHEPSDVQPWTFRSDGVIENVQLLRIQDLRAACARADDVQALSSFLHRTRVGDVLAGAKVLRWRLPTSDQNTIEDIVALRCSAGVISQLTKLYANDVRAHVRRSKSALGAGALADAHQQLRYATQELLVGDLVARGWTIRGSKKRPEIAMAFATDPVVRDIIALVDSVMGLRSMSAGAAADTCARRHAFRKLLLAELKRLSGHAHRFEQLRTFYTKHNRGAFDYYSELLAAGFIRGPVNHIRSLSGFCRIPRQLCGESAEDAPITRFTAGPFTDDFKRHWLAIADLSGSTDEYCHWANQLSAHATALVDDPPRVS